MAQLKAHEVDGWLARPQQNTPIVLVYGPDRGLVSERARRFAEKAGVPLDDPFSVVKLDASDLDKEPGRLLDEANTLPMFAGKRLLWVRNAGGQKTLADDVKALCKVEPEGITGAITGRAIYEGKLDFAAAQKLADELSPDKEGNG